MNHILGGAETLCGRSEEEKREKLYGEKRNDQTSEKTYKYGVGLRS